MKLYSVEVEVTTRWVVEIEANDESEARQKVEEIDFADTKIEAEIHGDSQSVEIMYIEEELSND